MNKRELSKIERPKANKNLFSEAEMGNKQYEYLVTADIEEISGEKILLLNFFKRSQLLAKKSEAQFRTFLSSSDYITQDLTEARVKRKTACFYNMLGWYLQTMEEGHVADFVTSADFLIAKKFISKYVKKEDKLIWSAFYRFQNQVMEKRVKKQHKRETDKIDKKMEIVPKMPEDLKKWAYDTAMRDKRYLIYEAGKKQTTTGYCTCCKRNVVIDTKLVKPRNKKQGECPNCKGNITFIPKGFFPTYQRDSKWVCLLQQIENGLVIRYFHVYLEIQRDNNFKERFTVGELCRTFYEQIGTELRKTNYEWDVYKQRGVSRWCPDGGKQDCSSAVVYTENLPQVLQNTVFQYCALDIFQKKSGCSPIPVYKYMDQYLNQKFLEYFIKAGMINLTKSIVNGYAYFLNTSGKTPTEILNVPMDYIKTLIEIDGTEGELRLLQQCAADEVPPNAKDIQQYYERFGGNDEMLGVVNIHMKIGKFIRYVEKQKTMIPIQPEQTECHTGMRYRTHYTKEEKEKIQYKDIAKDWLDYIKWCATLKYNMQDRYVLLPPDFKKAHDRLMVEYQAFKDEQERKKQKEIDRRIKKVLKAAEKLPIMIKSKDFMLVIPKNGEEIRNEGRILHHCVGTYVERVAKGETMILFVRYIEKPEEPYFTLEYKNGKVVQCRGKNNCAMTNEVKAFVEVFEKNLCSQEKKEGKKVRKVG